MSLFYINCDCGEKIPKNGDIGAPRRKKPKFWSFGLELPPYDRKCPKCGAEYKKYWIIDQLDNLLGGLMLPIVFVSSYFIYEIFLLSLLSKIYFSMFFLLYL
ncbi:hypothetical protein PTQ35_03050 [Campylobacter sp. 46490-21]|uniref:hypothetical protein n=1 Tax=Campylobacter magnus TaxID=3026462 RepID=UPI00235EF53B|nr:hypothetical protein [Campylobacter magnus]MDD0847792.1 hypothetical protein [Campylobacter magnus]